MKNELNVTITYKQFEKCIKAIILENDYIHTLYNLSDGAINLWENEKIKCSNALYELLYDLLPHEDYDKIGFWLYECDCGRKSRRVLKQDGKDIPFSTIKDLWNVITGEF